MSSTKNPENEAEIPAPMPRSLQGGKKAKMAPQPSVPPGLEQDAHGNAIPFEQRTQDDQDMARRGVKDK